jgi:hypothetical protein
MGSGQWLKVCSSILFDNDGMAGVRRGVESAEIAWRAAAIDGARGGGGAYAIVVGVDAKIATHGRI